MCCIYLQLELFVLLFPLYLLWFSSPDESLQQLNLKLLVCAVRFFFYVRIFFKFENYWKNKMMLLFLITGNLFIIIIPSSDLVPMCLTLHTSLLVLLIEFIVKVLHFIILFIVWSFTK